MAIQRKTLVRLFYQPDSPGKVHPEETIQEIPAREDALKVAFEDRRVFAFQIGTCTFFEAEGKTVNLPAWFLGGRKYFGEVFTVDELKAQGADHTLISNIENDGCQFAVKTRLGNWQPVHNRDEVYSAESCALVFKTPTNETLSRTAPPAPVVK